MDKARLVSIVIGIVCIGLMLFLLFYVMNNVQLLTTNPCMVCEEQVKGTVCSFIPDMIGPIS